MIATNGTPVSPAEPPDIAHDPLAGFRIGVDVAAVNDYPALAVVAPVEIPVLDANGVPDRDCNRSAHRMGRRGCAEGWCVDRTDWKYPVLTARRLPRGRALRATAETVVSLARNLRAAETEAPIEVYVDRGGMGRGVAEDLPEMLSRAGVPGVRVWGVQITGGETGPVKKNGREINVSKVHICANLLRLVEARALELPADLRDAEPVVGELRAFRPKQTANKGALTFEAERTGDHDDLVTALALACMMDPARGRVRVVAMPESWT